MSGNIYWRPIDFGKKRLPEMAPSSFMEILKKTFGTHPTVVSGDDIRILTAMSLMGHHQKSLEILIEAVDRHGEIEVFIEY